MISPSLRLVATVVLLASVAPLAPVTAQTIPGLENYSLPAQDGAPVIVPAPAPVPSASPTPRPTPTRAVPPPSIQPVSADEPLPEVTPTPTPVPEAEPVEPIPVPEPTETSAPLDDAEQVRARDEAAGIEEPSSTSGLLWPAVLAGLVLLALIWWWRRRRPDETETEEFEPEADPQPLPAAPAVPVAPAMPVAATPRARLSVSIRPLRAGLNLLSATAECEVTITNSGDAAADQIRLDVRLFAAGAGQEADLAALHARPIGRTAVPTFALAPGEERRVRAVAALPRDAIRPMQAGGRPMFVPILSVNAVYAAGVGIEGQTARAFAIGVERADSVKLAPLWLDGAPRMHQNVAARPHAVAVER